MRLLPSTGTHSFLANMARVLKLTLTCKHSKTNPQCLRIFLMPNHIIFYRTRLFSDNDCIICIDIYSSQHFEVSCTKGIYAFLWLRSSDWLMASRQKFFFLNKWQATLRERGRDLTQSYDKSPYTNRNVKRAKWQHKQRHKKVRLNSGCGLTSNSI